MDEKQPVLTYEIRSLNLEGAVAGQKVQIPTHTFIIEDGTERLIMNRQMQAVKYKCESRQGSVWVESVSGAVQSSISAYVKCNMCQATWR